VFDNAHQTGRRTVRDGCWMQRSWSAEAAVKRACLVCSEVLLAWRRPLCIRLEYYTSQGANSDLGLLRRTRLELGTPLFQLSDMREFAGMLISF
jgi:hypothetical protein